MRPVFSRALVLAVLLALAAGGCDYWPEELEALAGQVAARVAGEATAWRFGKDVVVIDVAGSPLYGSSQARLEAVATELAQQAVAATDMPIESVSITFHESDVTEDPERMRQHIFLIREGRPVLKPAVDFSATGPLTLAEIRANFLGFGEQPPSDNPDCFYREIEERARAAGDPQTLDPATVEFLPTGRWWQLDAAGKRLILMQAITTKAAFVCLRRDSRAESAT